MQPPPNLPYDVLQEIFQALHEDTGVLALCCLLNRETYRIASAILYRTLDLEIGTFMGPGWHHSWGIALSQTDPKQVLLSACLPHNRDHVRTLILRGTYDRTLLPAQLFLQAMLVFTNLRHITFNLVPFMGTGYRVGEVDPECLRSILRCLRERNLRLQGLAVNYGAFKTSEDIAMLLHSETRELSLINTSFLGRDLEWNWVGLLEGCERLKKLQIRSCRWTSTNFTNFEHALRFLPSLQSLTLGLISTSQDNEVFQVLSQTPCLRDLTLEYRLTSHPMRQSCTLPTTFTPLCNLKSFTLRYKALSELYCPLTPAEISKWIKHAVGQSPLEQLSFLPFYQPRTRNPKPKQSWDALVDHLVDKHAGTLRGMDLRAGFVRKRSLKKLLKGCVKLEVLKVGTSRGALDMFVRNAQNVPVLHEARFELRTSRRDKREQERERLTSIDEARTIVEKTPSLRRLCVDDDMFLASWILEGDGLARVVERIH
ncbi:hypothetical protein VNI00_003856 [Paramarasmius palmivorus]|uniref:F-box domain-containing protein n=1 Tax=Paramarasmius palmivorus TaxID=297713 RepID=A0AAW0DPY1_9AGAR